MSFEDIQQKPFDERSRPIAEIYQQAIKSLTNPIKGAMLPEYKYFNEITGGFRPREFSILCGSTGTGKTTLLANWSKQLIEAGTKHYVMSVETGPTDFVQRVMSVYAGVDYNTGDAVPLADIKAFHGKFGSQLLKENCYLSLYDNRVATNILVEDLVYHCNVIGCKVAFIDNLNFFMEVTSSSNSIMEMDRVIHELIILAKRIDMHIVMVMHPKKTENGRVENEFDIKGSSTAVQEAHNVFLFNKPRKENKGFTDDDTDREILFAKLRKRGKHVGTTIVLKNNNSAYSEKRVYGNY